MDAAGNTYLAWTRAGALETRVRRRSGTLTPIQKVQAGAIAGEDRGRAERPGSPRLDQQRPEPHRIGANPGRRRHARRGAALHRQRREDPGVRPRPRLRRRRDPGLDHPRRAAEHQGQGPHPRLRQPGALGGSGHLDPAVPRALRHATGGCRPRRQRDDRLAARHADHVTDRDPQAERRRGPQLHPDADQPGIHLAGARRRGGRCGQRPRRLGRAIDAADDSDPFLPTTCISAVDLLLRRAGDALDLAVAERQRSRWARPATRWSAGPTQPGRCGSCPGSAEQGATAPRTSSAPLRSSRTWPWTAPAMASRSGARERCSKGAGFDAVPPKIKRISIPRVIKQGVRVRASARVFDVWGAAIRWRFGDGHVARGRSVHHTYEHPGTFRVRVSAVDGAGALRVASRSVRVKRDRRR